MMHKHNLAIETECDWGVPMLTKPKDVVKDEAVAETPPDTKKTVTKGTYHDYGCPCMKKAYVEVSILRERE